MQSTKHNKLLSERRAVSALPGQRRRTEGLVQYHCGPGTRLSSAPSGKSSRSLPLSSSSSVNSAVLNDWLSRASSAVSVRSMRTSSRCYSTNSSSRAGEAWDERHSSCNRPTRASILRQKTCPARGEQPNYQEVIKKRKAFTLRCKSLSASNIRCKTIPEMGGESLHAFITGARYNRAHNMDSRSLERVGVYISRCDATRSFVNQSSTSQDICGTGYETRLDTTDQGEAIDSGPPTVSTSHQQHYEVSEPTNATSQKLEKPEKQRSSSNSSSNDLANSDRRNSTHDNQSYHSNHAEETAAENSILNPPNEHQATSRQVLTPTSHMSKEMLVSDEAQDPKECDSSWNEIVPSSPALASAISSQEVVNIDHNHANIEDSISPQHSRTELLQSTATEDVLDIHHQKESQELPQATVAVVNDDGSNINDIDDSEDELISPEARALITDEILRECQRSSSSFASSSVSQDQETTETMQDSDLINEPLLPHPQKQLDSTNTPTRNRENFILATNRTSGARNDVGENQQESDYDLQAASSERELSAKSSCIFVDMSSLNLDQVQEEEAID